MHHNTASLFRHICACAIASGIVACGSNYSTNGESVAESKATLAVPAEDRALVESPERTLVCPPHIAALEDGSYQFPDDIYYPDVIDSELRDYPELAAAVGADNVSTCEQARAWTANRLVLVEGESPLTGEVTNLSSVDSVDTADTPVVDKLLNGLNHVDDSVLEIAITSPANMGRCSAVAISPFHLLTSAHCVPPNQYSCLPGGYSCALVHILVYRSTVGSRELIYYTTTSPTVITYKHEGYGGVGDAGDDIALVELPGWNYPTSKCRKLGLSSAWSTNVVAGWGSTSNTTDNGGLTLKKPPTNTGFVYDGYAPNFTYFYDNNDDDVNLCKGDSGSPAVETVYAAVVGIASQFEVASASALCRIGTYKEWWTEVARKMPWIEARMPNWGSFTCPVGGSPCCKRDALAITASCF